MAPNLRNGGTAGAKVWNISYVSGAGNCTSLLDIDGLDAGDVIRIWGVDGHTSEGGITINVPGVSVIRWEGSPARLLITNSSGNHLDGCNGAGVFAEGRDGNPLRGFDVRDCVFSGNSAGTLGGAMYLNYVKNSRINGTTFESNTANYGSGAFFLNSADAVLTSICFENNTADRFGGVCFIDSDDAVIRNCLLDNDNNLCAETSLATALNEASITPGINIAGGPCLGGNVWLRDPDHNISEWGADADFDGICDQNLTITDFGTDEYPLVCGVRGTVEVSSTPAACVCVDGVKTTRTTDTPLYLPVGMHNIRVSLGDHVTPPEQVVSVTAGNTTTVSFDLVHETGNLTDSTLSDIWTGDHTVTVRLDGYVTPPEQTVGVTAGNITNISFSPDPVTTPTRRTQSSDGGHSGLSAGAAENLPEGGQVSFAVQNSAFSEVNITARESIPELLVTVGRKGLPSGIEAPNGTLYEYDEFLLYHATGEMIRGLSLNFGVSKTWLSEHGLVPGDVLLYSLHDGKWQAVVITLTGEDSGSYHFTASSQGFSSFAIFAEPLREPALTPISTFATVAEVLASATATTAPAGTQQQSPIFWGTAVLGAGAALLLRRRR